jgi:hypothetical protein
MRRRGTSTERSFKSMEDRWGVDPACQTPLPVFETIAWYQVKE